MSDVDLSSVAQIRSYMDPFFNGLLVQGFSCGKLATLLICLDSQRLIVVRDLYLTCLPGFLYVQTKISLLQIKSEACNIRRLYQTGGKRIHLSALIVMWIATCAIFACNWVATRGSFTSDNG